MDADRLVIYGESAGANLASLAGTAYDDAVFRRNVADTGLSLKPQAVIAHYPPVDFLQIDPMLKAQGCSSNPNHNDSSSFESAYLGEGLLSVPDKVAQANPALYATAGDPPFFIQNGDADCNVGAGQSALLVSALKEVGVRVTYEQLPGAGHGGPQFETADNIAKIRAFLMLNKQ